MTDTVSSNNLTSLYGSTDTNVNLATPSDPALDSSIASKNFTTLYSGGGADPIPVTVVGNTTYNIASAVTGGGGNLLLTGSDGSSDFVTFASGTGITVSSTDSSTILITNTNPAGTTYAINASTVAGGANLNLVGSDASTDAVKFASGTGITVTRTDADTITITNSSPGSAGVTSITGTANQVIASASTGAVTLSTPQDIATTSSPTFAGITAGLVTVGAGDPDTITTTSGNLFLQSTGGEVQVNGDFEVTGNGNFNGIVAINNDQTVTNPSYQAYSGSSLGSLTWNGTVWDATGGINSDGAAFGNITIAVTTDNTISTTTGDLTITSAGTYVTVNKDAVITGSLAVQADAITINSDKTNFDTYLNFGRVAPNNNAAIRWNATTNRFEFNADGTSPTNWSPFVQTLDDLSDVIITTPAAGNVLTYNGSNFVNNSTVTSLTGATRFKATYQNSTSTATSSLLVNRDYDTYTYVTGDSTAVQYQITSDTQATVGIGLTGFAYSATDPSFLAVTTTDNFTTRTTVMDVNGTDAKFDATILTLNYNLTGAATDAYYAVNRGSTGADVALRWNSSTNKWQFTNDGTTYYDMADNSGHTFGNITVGSVTPNTISTTTGDLLITAATSAITITGATTMTGDLNVQGGDITNSTGELRITSGSTDSNIVLTPSGTGDVLLTADSTIIGDLNTNAALTTNGTGDLVLNTNNGTNSGQITILNGANANINIVPNGTGDVILSADIVQVGDANTAATITTNGTGNLILNTNNGTNAGTLTLANGVNGNMTLAPNGSGSVALTLANGGNLTNTRNYVQGAIRNATTAAAGEVFTLGPSGTGFKGISLDNSADTADGPMTILRSFTGGAVAGAGTRGRVIFERARGTSASPTAVQSGDQIGSLEGTGYTSTGWLADTLAVMPSVFNYTATENWISNTNLGTQAQLLLAPTATTIATGANLVSVLAINPQTFASRSDAFTWANGKTGTTQTMALDVSGNLTVTGDVRINGNDIQNSSGTAVISMTGANTTTTVNTTLLSLTNPTTQTTYGGSTSLLINAGNPAAASFNDRVSQLRVQTATTSSSEASTITFNTGKFNTGTNLFSATQSGDYLGEFFFGGNYGTTGTFTTLGPSVRFRATAAENFTASASGGAFAINVDKIGGTTPLDAISISSANAVIASDALTLNDSNSVNLVGSKITYNRVYGAFQYNTTVTPAAANTAAVFPIGIVDFSNIVSVGSTSRIIIGAAGLYNLQFSVQVENTVNAEHVAYIWLRKNGTDVTGSMGRINIPKSGATIAGWNYVISSANTTDYYELAYAVNDTAVIFPTYAATAFGPGTASLITTVTPIGA